MFIFTVKVKTIFKNNYYIYSFSIF